MRRRDFLRSTAGATLSGLIIAPGCGPGAGSEAAADAPGTGSAGQGAGNIERVGLQLYTVRSLMQEDVGRTLDLVASTGYREVEFAGLFGRSPAEVRGLLDASGLAAPSAHVGLPDLRERMDLLLEAAGVMGHRYLVLPFLAESDRSTLDGYRSIADELNGFGESCRAAGVQFAYHNHEFEFDEMEGGIGYDVLLERCDPELVQMELDLFWIRVGGLDPLDYFQRYPGRFPLCHVKDMDAAGEMVSVGAGVIDFPGIFAHSDQAGLRHWFVEHDNPADPAASIQASYQHLARLTF